MPEWIIPLTFIIAGLLAGLIGEKFIFKKLRQFVESRQIPGGDIIFQSLHRMTLIWFVIAGLSGAIISYQFKANIENGLQKILVVIFLFSVTLVLARLTAGFLNLFIIKTGRFSASLFSNIAKAVILSLGLLIILQTIGIEITPVLTTLGIGGLAVGLALKDTLENLFAGLYLVISKQVKTGDYIKLEGGYEGYVTDITWRHTTIRELANNVIIVPNAKLSSAIFTNYHLPAKEITLTITVGVGYNSDLEKVEAVTVEVAREVMQEIAPLVVSEPFIRFQNFGDFSINFILYMRVNEFFDQRMGKHLFIKKLHQRYQQEEIEIPMPTTEIYVKNNSNQNGGLKVDKLG